VAAMGSDVSGEEFNVGSGTEASAREIAESIIRIVDAPVDIVYQPDVRVFMRRRVGSNEKARRLLGWEVSISLEDGLRDTVDWIRRTS
jgi:UDP-N-acetylglucosamine/UDP-N-acetyl-alpha-D-glucosaminouronate 4-epimerase